MPVQRTSDPASVAGDTRGVPNMNDAGAASSVGNGVNAAARWINGGYNWSGSIRPPSTNISFCHTQYTGATSCSQNAISPMPRYNAVINALAANPNGTTTSSAATGGVHLVNANAQTNAVSPRNGARTASTPSPLAYSAATYDTG